MYIYFLKNKGNYGIPLWFLEIPQIPETPLITSIKKYEQNGRDPSITFIKQYNENCKDTLSSFLKENKNGRRSSTIFNGKGAILHFDWETQSLCF